MEGEDAQVNSGDTQPPPALGTSLAFLGAFLEGCLFCTGLRLQEIKPGSFMDIWTDGHMGQPSNSLNSEREPKSGIG